jgi:amidohydrolase
MPPSTEDLLQRLLAGLERELPGAVALRRRLHSQPELAHAEVRTAAAVEEELPVACATVAGTGRIARVGAPYGAAVAVRAELDGLPVSEHTDASFSAGGGVMHACGHDVHMAALVALTRAAHALGDELPAPLVAIFQPSEEAYPSGAEELAREELAAIAPAAVVAAHVHPELPWGAVALDPGAVNASSDSVEITVTGEPSHAAYPHHGRDPILAIAQIVLALHAQVARRIDPHSPAVLTVGVLEGGSTENVIPAHARARASLRAHRPEDRLALRLLVEEVVSGVAAAHGCRGAVELVPGEPALENDPRIVARARELLAGAGLETAPQWRSCGSDDFAFFGALAPLAMAFVGLEGAEGFNLRPLHHPEFLPPDSAVGAVARVQAILYVAGAATAGARAVASRQDDRR